MEGRGMIKVLIVDDARTIYAAVCGAGRALGFVCAPSLIQHVIAKCAGQVSDLSVYKKNRDLLYDSLTAYGFTCVHPDGAFYLFMKTPEPTPYAFVITAQQRSIERLFAIGLQIALAISLPAP